MLNKIKAMNNFGIEVNEIKEIIEDGKIFVLNNGQEYYVLTDNEAQEIYEDMEKELINDLGLEAFTPMAQEYIINNCLNLGWFDEYREEFYQMEIEEYDEEELLEQFKDYNVNNEEELLEGIIKESMREYGNSFNWHQEYCGISNKELTYLIDYYNLLDVDKVIEYCQEIDGRGHMIASYDGKENIIEEKDKIKKSLSKG